VPLCNQCRELPKMIRWSRTMKVLRKMHQAKTGKNVQFKSAGQAPRFLSAHDQINDLFHLRRDHVTAAEYRASRTQTFQVWAEICRTGCQ